MTHLKRPWTPAGANLVALTSSSGALLKRNGGMVVGEGGF
jgi:hypothetical protein